MSNRRERIEAALKTLPLTVAKLDVWASDAVRVMARVESPNFAGTPDHVRQELVWAHVFETVAEEDRRWLEFVFTDAPGESAAA